MKRFTLATIGAMITLLLQSCGGAESTSDITTDTTATDDSVVTDSYIVDPQINADSVAYSFVFVGCNRIDRHDTNSPNTNGSTANIPELKRTFNEVANLNPKPQKFFFLGDLVLGLDSAQGKLSGELADWVTQYNNVNFSDMPDSGIEMIAVPGNHEMLWYNDSAAAEQPWQPSMEVWMQHMSPFTPAGPINRVGGPDSLEQRGTYSFDYEDSHFILVNTDTYNSSEKIGVIPANWIANDIAAARADSAINHIFVMGHKPSYIDGYEGKQPRSGKDIIQDSLTAIVWPVMDSLEVEAMLSAHSHQYWRSQPQSGKSYQIVAGNGGSPYVKHLPTNHQFFGYTVVYVMLDGSVQLRSMGRDIPKDNYLDSIPAGTPTTVKDAIDISWGTSAPAWNAN